MYHSETRETSRAKKSALSLPPQIELPFLVNGGPLASHPPQQPSLPFLLHRSNAVRRAPIHQSVRLSSTILTSADIEDASVPEPQTNNNRRRCRSQKRNITLATHQPEQPRVMARYYGTALTAGDHVALACGVKNHNLRPWTLKDMVLLGESRKHLLPTNTYIGPDKQVYIIPLILVTEGQYQRTHIQQLRQQFNASRSRNAPFVSPIEQGPIEKARVRAYDRAARSGSDLLDERYPMPCRSSAYLNSTTSRARSPLANEMSKYRPSNHNTFDTFLPLHCSGKGEMYSDVENTRTKDV